MKTIKNSILFLVLTFGILCAQRTLIYAGSMIDGEVKKMKTKQTIIVENGVVIVDLQGSCSGCPSSLMTLKQGVQNLLCHYLPEVKEVVAIQ